MQPRVHQPSAYIAGAGTVLPVRLSRLRQPDRLRFRGVPKFDSLIRGWIGWNWPGIDPPRHLHHFRAASIRLVAARAGLKVVQLDTESFPEHIELDLANLLRRRALVPARFTLGARLNRPLARYLARKGSTTGRGEALNLHLRRENS